MLIQRVFAGRERAAFILGLWMALASTALWAQQPPPSPPPLPPPGQTLTANQLDDLVAPIALYPDELVGQIMVAATYPLEVVEASEWAQRNPKLTGAALTEAAKKQDWDPSVQALVMFPDVMKLLVDDITWTTNLGNAFLAQQQDVMDAVQHMRQQAQQAGKLNSTPQENVADTGGYIDIEPADPDMIYVPVYDPEWIWGPPLWYPYPVWPWPPRSYLRGGLYFGFGGGIDIGLFFGGGWNGWAGWGWHPGWGGHSIVVNNGFIHRYNFNTRGLASVRGTSVWQHNPEFRAGVPYPNAGLQDKYRANVRANLAPRALPEASRNAPGQTAQRFGNRTIPQNLPQRQQSRSAFGGMQYGSAASVHSEHGMSSLGPARSTPMSMPRSAPAPSRGGGGDARGGGGRR